MQNNAKTLFVHVSFPVINSNLVSAGNENEL